ncbi:expansin-A13 isoform X2 [Benincasa hispida]|uniref:expansin-A13 isoform X2 n=1 Tax=Benincasa hispida TaxID=102211 RepID=UPI0019002FB2|nr:expansin-A13 isoform X2 [Benincasa hispida]
MSPCLPLHFLFTVAALLTSPVTSHFSSTTSSPSPDSAPSLSDWRSARATYYAASDPRDAVGGACGYGDLVKAGYGMATVGLSESLFERGQICGACFQLRCVEDLRWCIPGTSIIVTVTNFCAPNYGFTAEGGGHCNPPNKHFVLPIEAFEKIAIWKAGNMPVQYRSVCCCLLTVDSFEIIFPLFSISVVGLPLFRSFGPTSLWPYVQKEAKVLFKIQL